MPAEQLARRIQLFMSLPIEKLDKLALKEKLSEIGRIRTEEIAMKKLQIFDPALCCSTGVCGVDVDQALVAFSADVDWVKQNGAQIERFNLAQQPLALPKIRL